MTGFVSIRQTKTTMATQELSKFKFQFTRLHLTYKTHLDRAKVVEKIGTTAIPIVKYSFVWENADEEAPYQHTHILVWLSKRKCIKSPRTFDIDGVHPHMLLVSSDTHWNNVVQYHEKAPQHDSLFPPIGERNDLSVAPEQMDGEAFLHKLKKAKTLYDACLSASVDMSTLRPSDVKLLRDDKEKPEGTKPIFTKDQFTLQVDRFRTIILHGESGCGKTMWALAQFESALLVTHIDQLRSFDPNLHDGIVFDDMSFLHCPMEFGIHLLDWDLPRQIHCRYAAATIPANTRKIFTTNVPDGNIFPNFYQKQIQRRITKSVKVESNLFEVAEEEEAPIEFGVGDSQENPFVLDSDDEGLAFDGIPDIGLGSQHDYCLPACKGPIGGKCYEECACACHDFEL